MCRLYANTTPFHTWDLSIRNLVSTGGPGTTPRGYQGMTVCKENGVQYLPLFIALQPGRRDSSWPIHIHVAARFQYCLAQLLAPGCRWAQPDQPRWASEALW